MVIERRLRDAPRAATIYDVAGAANVSPTTVTRVLSGFTGIRDSTRIRVERAIAELDYRPNLTAKSLATLRETRIGALIQDVQEVGPARIINGASRAAREAGFTLDIIQLEGRTRHEIDAAIKQLVQRPLAGMIAFVQTDDVADAFARAHLTVPTHIAGGTELDLAGRGSTTNDSGEALLVEHLVALGHRRFMHVSGPLDWHSSRQRAAAYHLALKSHGLRSVGSIVGDWSSASGYAAGTKVPVDGTVTAVLAANDQTAFGLIRALSDRGIRVPEDVSVAGFDDIPEAQYFRPSITTVSVDFDLLGRVEVRELLAQIDAGLDGPRPPSVPFTAPTLRIRESTGNVRTS